MKLTVVLDPGHGGRDPGAVAMGLREKDLNLNLAHKVAARLDGIKVLLTRESDIFVSLKDRVSMCSRAEADLFVSLHVNAGGGHGFESYIYQGLGAKDPSVRLRNAVHNNVMAVLSRWEIRDRGRKYSAFHVLRYNRTPAVLIESLFIDHEREARLWREPPFIEALAGGVAAGIREYLSGGDSDANEKKADTVIKLPAGPKADDAESRGSKTEESLLYTVQVGAFAYLENARRCLDKARNAGFKDAFIFPKKIS
ncbi:MAG: N-acetylmuramoyl-L-alanine amidase [Dethiobacteria bacterium]